MSEAPPALRIRPARAGDADALVPLLRSLGYGIDAAAMELRLAAMLDDARGRILVAETDSRVIGLMVGESATSLHRGRVARLALLVVEEAARGRGVGRALLRAFEAWAAEMGVEHASLTSALHREGAHAFYRACGWEATGWRFARRLGGPPDPSRNLPGPVSGQ